ncbi:MAG TPA: YceI family protein [Acidimicrobiales bacterium]|nr:YceI family protein [Acidimicrobiales bacterium]
MALDPNLHGNYTIDPTHSSFGFVARHAMVTKVRGTFDDFTATGHLDAEDPSKSKINVSIDVASVDTGVEQRDDHLRTNDFFDAPNHPTVTFDSTSIEAVDASNFRVTGDLTVKETTKPVTFNLELSGPVTDPWGNTRIGLEGSLKVNRKDWGLNWNTALETGGVLVSEKVTLTFDVAATKDA